MVKEKKKSKRYYALETIRIEFARHGEATRDSTRAYIENRISHDACLDAAQKGLRQYKAR